MSLNITDFANVIIPVILYGRTDYYVKGGRVHDIYFKDSTNSIDWDLVGTKQFLSYVESKCEEWAKKFDKTLITNTAAFGDHRMIQYGFQEYEEEKGDPYIFDILIYDNITKKEYTTINGINYMKMENFVEDLIITLHERAIFSKNYFKVSDEPDRDVKEYNKKHGTNFNLDQLEDFDQQTIDHFKNYIKKIKSEKVKEIIQDSIINKIINKGEEDDPQSILYDMEPTKKEVKELDKFVDFYEDWNSEINANVRQQRLVKIEKSKYIKKYIKTNKRTNNVINIKWENLTDVYKTYLINECITNRSREIELFKVNETCKAILNCRTNNVRSTTKKCIKNPELIQEVNLLVKN